MNGSEGDGHSSRAQTSAMLYGPKQRWKVPGVKETKVLNNSVTYQLSAADCLQPYNLFIIIIVIHHLLHNPNTQYVSNTTI